MKRIIFIVFIGLFGCTNIMLAQPFRIVSYNVENLFYPECDSINTDTVFTPAGERHWSLARYFRKVENIARVLTNIGEWNGVDMIGIQEVEDKTCVERLCNTLRKGEYDFVHFDSPDQRGIDVALIYKKSRVDTLQTRTFSIPLGEQTTRDILYVCARIDKTDTLHLFVCHLPSQRGGRAETQWKRTTAKRVLQTAVDSVLAVDQQAKIIVMGDMNSSPQDDISGLSNLMMEIKDMEGTHKHQGKWNCLDQFYISPAIKDKRFYIYNAEWIQESDEKYLGLKPKRTYNGYRYQNGFSDHLPIILDIF